MRRRHLITRELRVWSIMILKNAPRRLIGLIHNQTPGFKLLLWRRTLHSLASSLSLQYNSIYATLLGADPVQLGSLQSVGNAVGALATLPAGWFIDYYSLKKVFLLGVGLLTASKILYFVAPHWVWLYAAIILFYLGSRVICTSCTVTCARELSNEGRATGRGLCRTLSSLVGVFAPLLAAWIVSLSGGIALTGIRPLYAIQAVLFAGMFVLLMAGLPASKPLGKLRTMTQSVASHKRPGLSSFAQVFRQGPDVVRLLFVMGLMELPWTITQPFMPLYAHEFKGANEFLLSSITTASTLVPLLMALPLGRLADRYGRKKLLFALAPLTYIANLCLIFAPISGLGKTLFLLLYGVLFGFNSITMILASSMTAEIMPQEQMGRWIGIVSLFRGVLAIPMPLLGGLIWEHVGPQHVFLAAIVLDAGLRLPLLARVGETLHLESMD